VLSGGDYFCLDFPFYVSVVGRTNIFREEVGRGGWECFNRG